MHITFAFALFAAFAAGSAAGEKLAAAFASALLHECVHLVFLIGFGCTGIRLTLNPGGASVKCAGMELLCVKKQLLTLLSAPSLNVVLGLLLLASGSITGGEALFSAASVNLWLGGINLLPVRFTDGGRALYAVLSERTSSERAGKTAEICGIFSVVLLTGLTLFLIFSHRPWYGAAFFTVYCIVFSFLLKK